MKYAPWQRCNRRPDIFYAAVKPFKTVLSGYAAPCMAFNKAFLSVIEISCRALQPSMLKQKNISASATRFKSNITLFGMPDDDI